MSNRKHASVPRLTAFLSPPSHRTPDSLFKNSIPYPRNPNPSARLQYQPCRLSWSMLRQVSNPSMCLHGFPKLGLGAVWWLPAPLSTMFLMWQGRQPASVCCCECDCAAFRVPERSGFHLILPICLHAPQASFAGILLRVQFPQLG